jgi:hypothetical protein
MTTAVAEQEHELDARDLQHDDDTGKRLMPPDADDVSTNITESTSKHRSSTVLQARKGTILHGWMYEVAYLLVATACFIAIVKLLVDANGTKQPDWRLQIGLNTLAALLSTLFRSTIVQVSGEGKRIHSELPRPKH